MVAGGSGAIGRRALHSYWPVLPKPMDGSREMPIMRIYLTALLLVLASAAGAQGAMAPSAEMPLAQNTGAADRGAAGNGSMGVGDGIDYIGDDRKAPAQRNRTQPSSSEQLDESAEPGHGGNETDMEHRRRPKLEKRSD